MKIKVLKCSNQLFWYNKHIGEVFDVVKVQDLKFWCREKDHWGCLNFIEDKDATILCTSESNE